MNKISLLKLSFLFILTFSVFLFTSCKEEYELEENIPTWLGKSIYDYLQNEGNYTNYIRLIDDLEYTEVLSKTGSKTLFVADDEAFKRFYENNSWGVKRYEDFSLSQKKIILRSTMINNAILLEGLSSMQGPVKGQVLRRSTDLLVTDTISHSDGSNLPENTFWDRFRSSGIYLAKDVVPANTLSPMVHFLEDQMEAKNITNEDFSILFNGKERAKGDTYVYDIKVKEGNITCQNGYIHVLEEVLIPPSNMADVISQQPETKLFSSFMERFSAPYFSETLTTELNSTDSIFVKGYFSERSNVVGYSSNSKTCIAPDGITTISDILNFDPGWNLYQASENNARFETDMAAIFAPTDAALKNYFETGAGKPLIERYGNINNIPNEVLNKLIKNHMKPSFLSSIPSKFGNVVDDAQEPMGIEKSHINKVCLASNGVVYLTNTVYSPALYSSVMFPATINENMKVFNWAIDQLDFDAYLLSMVNNYSFFIPTDHFTYIVPNTVGSTLNPPRNPTAWKFKYDNVANRVYASVHRYDIETNTVGEDSLGVVLPVGGVDNCPLRKHLEDMLDYHIVVGSIEDGKDFYRTKGNGTIKINKNGNQIQVAGGGDISRNTQLNVVDIYDQTKETNGRGNGKTYVLKEPLQSPLRSVYEILSTTPEFSEFFTLLQGNDELWLGDNERAVKYSVFYQDKSQAGLDLNVRFLSRYHYTLYVPTNEEVRKAIQNGLPTWEEVEAEGNQEERDILADKIIRFIRYHFQDNSIYLDRYNKVTKVPYETATLNLETETFHKLYLDLDNYSLDIRTDEKTTSGWRPSESVKAKVLKDKGLYNIMARDFKFNASSVDNSDRIITSAYVVIHQIDKCLFFE